jgi:hypothetical protein
VDTDLNDDLLKLVRYRLVWIGRGYEADLQSTEVLLNENLTGKPTSSRERLRSS